MSPPCDHPAPAVVQAEMTLAARRLKARGIADPMTDARRLMCHTLGIAPDRLALHRQDQMTHDQVTAFTRLIDHRGAGVPVSRLVGGRWFYGRWFKVTPHVLDPRPETEILVQEALARDFGTVLDLGTGSGCILVSLLAERPAATGVGTDISPHALKTAEENARALGVESRLSLTACNWTDEVDGLFDLIVSNPPYISAEEMPSLDIEVRDHDPGIALTDGKDGLTAYRSIAKRAPRHLSPGGRLIVEIGPTQAEAVRALLSGAGLADIRVIPDLDGRDRVVAATAP